MEGKFTKTQLKFIAKEINKLDKEDKEEKQKKLKQKTQERNRADFEKRLKLERIALLNELISGMINPNDYYDFIETENEMENHSFDKEMENHSFDEDMAFLFQNHRDTYDALKGLAEEIKNKINSL